MNDVKKLASQLREALFEECAALDPEAQSKFLLNAGWELFDDITWKVQAFLLGKAIWHADGKLAQLLHEELGADFATQTKNLEMLGFHFLDYGNPTKLVGPDIDPTTAKTLHNVIAGVLDETAGNDTLAEMSDRMGRELGDIAPRAWHGFLVPIFKSEMRGGWFWRSTLLDAFEGLVDGGTPELFVRRNKYIRGHQSDFSFCKRLAVLHVYYLVGEGRKADASRLEIAKVIGRDFQTLKAWCDAHRKSSSGKNEMECAKLAGQFQDEFSKRRFDEIAEFEKYGDFNGQPNLETADKIHWQLTDYPLKDLAKMLVISAKNPL